MHTFFCCSRALAAVLASNPGKLVVLMASLTWCRPCKTFQTTYEVSGSGAGLRLNSPAPCPDLTLQISR